MLQRHDVRTISYINWSFRTQGGTEFTHYVIIIIKSEIWITGHCLILGHEPMVCVVCLAMFFFIYIFAFHQNNLYHKNVDMVKTKHTKDRYALLCTILKASLHWRQNEHDGISNHRHLDCLLNHLFRCRSNKTSKLSVPSLYEGNPPVTRRLPSHWASNAVNVSIWWRHHESSYYFTHWGRVTHICVGKLTIIGSDDGLSPGRRQAIIWTNAGILLIGPLGTNFNETLIEIHTFSFKKIHLKMSSGKWRPFCLGLNVLKKWTYMGLGR